MHCRNVSIVWNGCTFLYSKIHQFVCHSLQHHHQHRSACRASSASSCRLRDQNERRHKTVQLCIHFLNKQTHTSHKVLELTHAKSKGTALLLPETVVSFTPLQPLLWLCLRFSGEFNFVLGQIAHSEECCDSSSTLIASIICLFLCFTLNYFTVFVLAALPLRIVASNSTVLL